MPNIEIELKNKKLYFQDNPGIVEYIGDNEDYRFLFNFDEHRNAYFAVFSDGKRDSPPVLIKNGIVDIPLWIMKSGMKKVGIISDGFATLPLLFYVRASIVDKNNPIVQNVDPSVAEQLIELVNQIQLQGVSDSQIEEAVEHFFEQNPITFPNANRDTLGGVKVGEHLAIDENGVLSVALESYGGNYEVTPTIEQKTLETANKLLTDDITVSAIPYHEVSNDSGGNTISIG